MSKNMPFDNECRNIQKWFDCDQNEEKSMILCTNCVSNMESMCQLVLLVIQYIYTMHTITICFWLSLHKRNFPGSKKLNLILNNNTVLSHADKIDWRPVIYSWCQCSSKESSNQTSTNEYNLGRHRLYTHTWSTVRRIGYTQNIQRCIGRGEENINRYTWRTDHGLLWLRKWSKKTEKYVHNIDIGKGTDK